MTMKISKYESIVKRLMLSLFILSLPTVGVANDEDTPRIARTIGPVTGMSVGRGQDAKEYRVLWPGHRILEGTVESVREDLVKVNTGELLPRFLSAKETVEKGFSPLKKGDHVQLVLNDQNLVIDYSPQGREVWHRIIRGSLAQPLPVGHEWAVIRQQDGKEEAFSVRPLARSKVSAIPVNVPAIFLTDEANKIVDASFGSDDLLKRQTSEWKKTPPKAPYRRVEGTLLRAPGQVLIKTEDGREQHFEVRPYLQEKLATASEGHSVILLLDEENKVSDLAKPPVS